MKADAQTYLTQFALQTLGFPPGTLDGKAGKNTRDAFNAFLADRWEGIRASIDGDAPDPFAGARAIGQRGLDLIKHFESSGELKPGSKFLTAYRCPADVWTIGYGHTGLTHKDGTVKAGRVITVQEAEDLLRHDLSVFAAGVDELAKVELNQDQFDALVSFAFNVGLGALKSSTLLRKLNAGDYDGAAGQFPQWNKGGGKVLAGLTRRRASERNLFLGKSPFIVKA